NAMSSRTCSARKSCGGARLQVARHRLPDLGEQLIAHHVVAHVDCRGRAFGVGTTMTFDDDAVEPEEDSPIRFSWIHFLSQGSKSLPRKQIAKPRGPGPVHCRAQLRGEVMRRPFGGLQCDISSEPFGDDNVDDTFADVIAFDKSVIVEVRKLTFAQNAARLTHLLQPFDFLDTDIEKPNGRAIDV